MTTTSNSMDQCIPRPVFTSFSGLTAVDRGKPDKTQKTWEVPPRYNLLNTVVLGRNLFSTYSRTPVKINIVTFKLLASVEKLDQISNYRIPCSQTPCSYQGHNNIEIHTIFSDVQNWNILNYIMNPIKNICNMVIFS